MIVLGGPAANGLDDGIARNLSVELVKVDHKVFPDGESYIRIPRAVEGEEVIVVQSTYNPQDKHIVELCLMLEALKDLKASKVTAVVPYLAYSRQDRRFKEGEALSSKTILNLIWRSGADALVVVEPHKPEALNYFRGDVRIVDPTPAIAYRLKGDLTHPFVLAPDRGALDRARRLASLLNASFAHVEKERNRDTGEVKIGEVPKEVHGKDVILIDDIVSTGSTMTKVASAATRGGARSITAVAIHFLSDQASIKRMQESGISRLVGTNTVPVSGINVVDLSEEIAKRL
ncbi:ribose-phosphate pyrophosphokinase [Sulfodiicoccus acidiphilus]|uniref:Ribose-phosphate pyrophosphokinase n=1 Tax=Sulfodiicoccus acidiphilus TaxID=1670455 RepID=A0A348B344_9CREN|nr:ribose-phosphate pyrophosphokinase [Sulfodiicoccus acidiphilus]BBD72596.1 ribose-phosphate pyrophosphokinase [Sulfodiicoccus acidiphilus]GGT93443.1 ribose-phosphate pyrophosphokinase [Sulfodiicoccus acidiphilus]